MRFENVPRNMIKAYKVLDYYSKPESIENVVLSG